MKVEDIVFKEGVAEDVENILFDPYVYSSFCTQASEMYELAKPEDWLEYDWYVNEDRDILFFVRQLQNKTTLEAHVASLKSGRGKKLFDTLRALKIFLKTVYGKAEEVISPIPSFNKASKYAIVNAVGAERFYVVKNGIVKDRFFHDLIIFRVKL